MNTHIFFFVFFLSFCVFCGEFLTIFMHTPQLTVKSILMNVPTANCQLPTANCQLPTANCQLFPSLPSIAVDRVDVMLEISPKDLFLDVHAVLFGHAA
jgi:hypothetical protein